MADAGADLLGLWNLYQEGTTLTVRFQAREALWTVAATIARETIGQQVASLPTGVSAPDATNEALTTRVLGDLDKFDPSRGISIPMYIRLRARYALKTIRRKTPRYLLEQQVHTTIEDDGPLLSTPDKGPAPGDLAARLEFWTRAADVLLPRELEVLRKVYVEAMEFDAIAASLKWRRQSVSRLHARALATLKQHPHLIAMLRELAQ